jgi:hypothetical protein
MRHLPFLLTLAACGLTLARPALAQEPVDAGGGKVPTCASQGVQRVAVMVPPGQTIEQFRETLRTGALFPVGTQVLILRPEQFMPLRNEEQFNTRLLSTLNLVQRRGMMIQGMANILLVLDEDGAVTRVRADSGDPEVDRLLVRTWRQARFEPYVFDGCRVQAWVQVLQSFTSDWSLSRRELNVRIMPVP